ncbi:MAG: hypothetical protein J3Q66DRAFT_389294 [Benniella sp.]|nr:MAG: hypothetical protein J3Q66DRAFT_389294 [Benniella sp.]
MIAKRPDRCTGTPSHPLSYGAKTRSASDCWPCPDRSSEEEVWRELDTGLLKGPQKHFKDPLRAREFSKGPLRTGESSKVQETSCDIGPSFASWDSAKLMAHRTSMVENHQITQGYGGGTVVGVLVQGWRVLVFNVALEHEAVYEPRNIGQFRLVADHTQMGQLLTMCPVLIEAKLQPSPLFSAVFDLPELTDIIFSYLSRNDLVQWARVSKKWHYVVIPDIWRDISTLNPDQHLRLAKMIIEDYQMMTDGCQQSALTKYCPLVRKLGYLRRDLIRGVFLLHSFHLVVEDTISFFESVRVIADSAVQQLRHLSIHGRILDCAFKYLISQCPDTLEMLELRVTPYIREDHLSVIEVDEARQEPLPNLRRLILHLGYRNELCHKSIYSIWKRCKSVEALELTCESSNFQPIATIIKTFFPNLNTISFGQDVHLQTVQDIGLATVLLTSQLGWRSVKLTATADLGERSWAALSRHASTLENFSMARWRDQNGAKPCPFLTTFPRLKSFVTISEGFIRKWDITPIDANEWIHMDPLSGSLTPWPCENSLTDLRIRISGIPRLDVVRDQRSKKRQPISWGFYPGEERVIQHRVYERLSRFVNLEVLWLGHNSYDYELLDCSDQYECLEMSLESGLDQLRGLKRLRVLNVSLMATRIGQKEAQWMAEQWPELRVIHGLEDKGDAKKARQWFKSNCPRISTPSLVRLEWAYRPTVDNFGA